MAIDQRDVSSTLRFMDDRALQQYAAMHKNDPYIFPLAFQESQNRQRMRMSQQGAQGMQSQPKVADAALAQMAPQPMPEDVGIGALPADNMQFGAEGGIMGYSDDNFAARSEPVVMMAGGGHVPRYQGNQRDGSLVMDTLYDPVSGVPLMAPANVGAEDDRTLMERLGIFNPENRRALEKAEREQAMREAAKTPGAKAAQAVASTVTPTVTPATNAPSAPPRSNTGRKAPAAAPTSAGLAGLQDPAKMYQDILAKQDYKDPAAGSLLELEATERANAAAERQAIATDAERFKEAYKGREGRLAEREADIGKQKESNTGLALLNAGLAIMSTPGGLATAIGKGAQVGTAQFAAGLDKIRSAQERLADARDRLDDLKLNREETTAKELRAAERNYRDVATNSQKRTIDGIRAAAGVSEKRAENIYNKTASMAETMYKEQQANLRTDKTVAGMLARAEGSATDKHTATLLKVQTVLQNNPAYKKAAEFAALPGSAGDKARVTMKQLEETAYRQFAPELLQSGQASPTGAGSGTDMSLWGKPQVVKP